MPIKIFFEDSLTAILLTVFSGVFCYYLSKSAVITVGFILILIILFLALKKRHIAFFKDKVEINNRLWGKHKYALDYSELLTVKIKKSRATNLIAGTVEIFFHHEVKKRIKFSFYDFEKINAMIEMLKEKNVAMEIDIL